MSDLPKKYRHLTIEDATHVLTLCHAIGKARRTYISKCILLGMTKGGKARVLKFGYMGFKHQDHKARISYVEPWKLQKIVRPGPLPMPDPDKYDRKLQRAHLDRVMKGCENCAKIQYLESGVNEPHLSCDPVTRSPWEPERTIIGRKLEGPDI